MLSQLLRRGTAAGNRSVWYSRHRLCKPHSGHRTTVRIYNRNLSTPETHCRLNCYQFIDPGRMQGLVDRWMPRDRTQDAVVRVRRLNYYYTMLIITQSPINAITAPGATNCHRDSPPRHSGPGPVFSAFPSCILCILRPLLDYVTTCFAG